MYYTVSCGVTYLLNFKLGSDRRKWITSQSAPL